MGRGMRSRHGFTLVEVLVGMLFVLAAGMLLPSFSMNLINGDLLWERRVAMRTIETELDWACDVVRMPPDGPNNVNPDPAGWTATDDWQELNTAATLHTPLPVQLLTALGTRTVSCVNGNTANLTKQAPNADGSCPGGETLKRVDVTVTWWSRRRQLQMDSAHYLISRTGICR